MIRRHRRSDRRGASAVEFALTTPVLASILVGVLDFGWFFVQQGNVVTIVRDGVRQGVSAVDGDPDLAEEIAESFIESELAARGITCHAGNACSIDASVDVSGAYDVLTATVSAEFVPLAGLPGLPLPGFVGATFTMLMEEQS